MTLRGQREKRFEIRWNVDRVKKYGEAVVDFGSCRGEGCLTNLVALCRGTVRSLVVESQRK